MRSIYTHGNSRDMMDKYQKRDEEEKYEKLFLDGKDDIICDIFTNLAN